MEFLAEGRKRYDSTIATLTRNAGVFANSVLFMTLALHTFLQVVHIMRGMVY